MSVKIKFNSFEIEKINYEKISAEVDNTTKEVEFNLNISKIKVGLSSNNKMGKITILGATKNNSDTRTLKLNISYYFEFEYQSDEFEDFINVRKSLIEEYGINISMNMYIDMIRQITSMDYNAPVVVNNYTMPGSIKEIN